MEIARYFGKNRKFFLCGDRLQNTYLQCCVQQSPGSSHKWPTKPGNIAPLPGGIHFEFTRFPCSKCLKMWFVWWSTELIEGAVACADVSGADLVSGSLAQRGGSVEMGKVGHGGGRGLYNRYTHATEEKSFSSEVVKLFFLIHSKMMQESST